jgi:regulation of enolase protein 1 (concanavalin A-like superfamily)
MTRLNGDGTIVARVATVQNVDAWTKAGVMMRETQTAGSVHAFMLVSPGKGNAFQRRGVTDGTSVSTAGSASTAPQWVKLRRSGHMFTAYESSDGTNWRQVGNAMIPMAQIVYAGLAVTSHNPSASATCTFDNVSFH